tara:strand:+ start:117 stop:281 length:165 start_codon:yes stop_codon:yes gene_type:complete
MQYPTSFEKAREREQCNICRQIAFGAHKTLDRHVQEEAEEGSEKEGEGRREGRS